MVNQNHLYKLDYGKGTASTGAEMRLNKMTNILCVAVRSDGIHPGQYHINFPVEKPYKLCRNEQNISMHSPRLWPRLVFIKWPGDVSCLILFGWNQDKIDIVTYLGSQGMLSPFRHPSPYQSNYLCRSIYNLFDSALLVK